MKVELVRSEVQRLLRSVPFRPFILTMVGGERKVIEHPENIAFDPRPGASSEFYAIGGSVRVFSTFDAVSSVTMLDQVGNESEEKAAA